MRIDDKVPGLLPIDLPRRLLAKRLSPVTSEGQFGFWRCAGRRRSDRRLDCKVRGDDLRARDIAPFFFDLDYPFNGFVVAGTRTSSNGGDGHSKCYRWRSHSTVPRRSPEEQSNTAELSAGPKGQPADPGSRCRGLLSHRPAVEITTRTTVEKGDGRIETRRYVASGNVRLDRLGAKLSWSVQVHTITEKEPNTAAARSEPISPRRPAISNVSPRPSAVTGAWRHELASRRGVQERPLALSPGSWRREHGRSSVAPPSIACEHRASLSLRSAYQIEARRIRPRSNCSFSSGDER